MGWFSQYCAVGFFPGCVASIDDVLVFCAYVCLVAFYLRCSDILSQMTLTYCMYMYLCGMEILCLHSHQSSGYDKSHAASILSQLRTSSFTLVFLSGGIG